MSNSGMARLRWVILSWVYVVIMARELMWRGRLRLDLHYLTS